MAAGTLLTTSVRAQVLPSADDSTKTRTREALHRFAPLVGGEWKAVGTLPDAGRFTASRTYEWALDSSFIRIDQTMRLTSGGTIRETAYIGWDAVEQRLRIWSFATDGSYSDGYEVQGEDPGRWVAEGRTFGGPSREWRITMFPFQPGALSVLLEVRSGRDFTPALTLSFRR